MINGWNYKYKLKPITDGDFDFYKITFPLVDLSKISKTVMTDSKTDTKTDSKTDTKTDSKTDTNKLRNIGIDLENKIYPIYCIWKDSYKKESFITFLSKNF